MSHIQTDCLIIGTGLAGCSVAYELSKHGYDILMITRAKQPEDSATLWAQGGIVFKNDLKDPEALGHDIFDAGGKIGNPKSIDILIREGPALVKKVLIDELQIAFDKNENGELELTEEAAHSLPRILHFGDATGEIIEKTFLNYLKEKPNITILTSHTAIDLLTLSHHSTNPADVYETSRCTGAYIYDHENHQIKTILAKETILATGGLGQLYLHTTNPKGSRGDGLAMAYRTGARIMNLEYIQFHPTALYQKSNDRFLISEAVRGEGAKILNSSGETFMKRYDPRAELAPRDIVSRALHDEMLKEGSTCMYLDISHKDGNWIRSRFPSIYSKCLSLGIDMTKEPIPVVPAAHYSCGGVYVDDRGNTTVKNLKAVGEVSCTGIHGGNRLASTSLLEDLVWGIRAGQDLGSKLSKKTYQMPNVLHWEAATEAVEKELLAQDWMTIKHTMWNYVGLIRTPKRLERAQRILR
ncbi:MAG: L-aspartate oxidase, partial [Bdellovibrionales bacterium]|nr:L-aspartate oxidase [Bdellovibrionales bacterium]